MANTFKFGNGNWAVKDGYALAYNDENNNFKPLPFDFTRASSATTLNRQGLIETVGSGKPRIDFTDNTSGHLLLEPSRANYSIYSEDTSTWTYTEFGSGSAGTITTGKTDMFGGTNAMQVDFPSNAENVSVRFGHTSSSISSGTVSLTLYIKLVSSGSKNLQLRASTSDIINVNSTEFVRYEVSGTKSSSESLQLKLRPSDGTSSGGFSIIVCHPQEEVGSYPTSYIPTEGSSVTRVVDDIALTFPDVDSFNSSSGFSVIAKFDIGAPNLSSSVPFLFFNDDSSDTYIGFGTNATNLRCRLNLSGTSYLNTQGNAPRTQRNSLFISCNSSGWSQGANGSTNHTGTNNASVFDRLASITFFTSETYGIIKISELLVYNTRLSNTELQNLTS